MRLRRRFLRFVPVPRGGRVLEVGCGSGVVLRDLAAMVGAAARPSASIPARRSWTPRGACRAGRQAAGSRLRHADGATPAVLIRPLRRERWPSPVILHVAEPLAVVREMARVTRPGGRVGLQDQDFGMLAVTHPDRALTDRIMQGVAAASSIPSRYSGRRLPRLLTPPGLQRVRILTDFFQDTHARALDEDLPRSAAPRTPCATAWWTRPPPSAGSTASPTEVAAGTFVLTMTTTAPSA